MYKSGIINFMTYNLGYNTCCPFSNEFFGKILIKALGKSLLLSCPFSDDFFGKMMGKILLLSCPFSDEYLGKILGKLFGKTLGKILGKISLWTIGSGYFDSFSVGVETSLRILFDTHLIFSFSNDGVHH